MRLLSFIGIAIVSGQLLAADETVCRDGVGSSQLSTTPSNRFTVDVTNKTVVDKVTGLMWGRCELGAEWSASLGTCYFPTSSKSTYTWSEALSAALSNQSNYLGQSGWRLPNVKELASIVEYKCVNPALNGAIFPGSNMQQVWSSSSTSNGGEVWYVDFVSGTTNKQSPDLYAHVRLVRDAP